MSAKQQYLVVRPFVAIDSEGNCITVEANQVWAFPPDDAWVKGEDSSQQFGVLESVFASSTVPVVRNAKAPLRFHPDLLAESRLKQPQSARARQTHSTRDSTHCPRCLSPDVRPSRRHVRAVSLWKMLCTRPFRCRTCDEKFLRFRWQG